MALYGVEQAVYYYAWDTANNTLKTGDSANHTLYWVKDGTASAATNAAAEVDGTNAPGIYKVVITATEAQCKHGVVGGKSSTADIELFGVPNDFVQLPNAAPGANGGLPTVNASNYVAGIQGTTNTLDDLPAAIGAYECTPGNLTRDEVDEIMVAMATGKIVNSATNVYDVYAENGTDVLYTLTKTSTGRTSS